MLLLENNQLQDGMLTLLLISTSHHVLPTLHNHSECSPWQSECSAQSLSLQWEEFNPEPPNQTPTPLPCGGGGPMNLQADIKSQLKGSGAQELTKATWPQPEQAENSVKKRKERFYAEGGRLCELRGGGMNQSQQTTNTRQTQNPLLNPQ